MRHIRAEEIDAKEFAPFGQVIAPGARPPELINEGTTQRFSDLASFDSGEGGAHPAIGLYVANARALPLRIAALERHRHAGQAFIPLGPHCFVVVVAPGAAAPQWEGVRAFVTRPGEGINLHRGAWHHGLVALGDGDRFAVIEGGNYRDDTELSSAPLGLWLLAPVQSGP